MKKHILGAILFASLLLPATCNACSETGALVLDLEESEFLGKPIGEQYQCVKWLNYHTVKLYNLQNPNNYLIIDLANKKDMDKYDVRFIENDITMKE